MTEFTFQTFGECNPNLLDSWPGHERYLFMGFLILDLFSIYLIGHGVDSVFHVPKSKNQICVFNLKIPSCSSVCEPRSQLCLSPWAWIMY